MQTAFGSGIQFITPLTDINGNPIATPTPFKLAILQDFSLDMSFDAKDLYGEQQYAIAVGRGQGKVGGKASAARILNRAFSGIYTGQPLSTGQVAIYDDLIGQAIPSGATLTPSPPSSGTWAADLGVRGQFAVPLTRLGAQPLLVSLTGGGGTGGVVAATVSGAGAVTGYTVIAPGTGYTTAPTATLSGAGTPPTAPTITVSGGAITGATGGTGGTGLTGIASGQYYVNAGAYQFAPQDVGTTIFMSYRYTLGSSGTTQAIINPVQGSMPTFMTEMQLVKDGKFFYIRLNNAYSSKLSLASKQNDFVIPQYDISALDDGTGNVGIISCSE